MNASRQVGWAWVWALAGIGAFSCAAPEVTAPVTPPPGRPAVSVAKPRVGCERVHPGEGARRLGTSLQGSSVALARGAHLVAYVADRDARRLDVVDIAGGVVERSVALGGTPEQLLVLADGRVVATLSDKPFLEVYEPVGDSLELACTRPVPAGGFGLALTPDGRKLGITSSVDATLTLLDADTLAPLGVTAVARSPRGVLLEDDRAFVSHSVGAALSTVDLTDLTRPAESIGLHLHAATEKAKIENLSRERSGAQAYALTSVTTAAGTASTTGAAGSAGKASTAGEHASGVHGAAPPPPLPPRRTERIVVPMVSVDPGDESDPTQYYYGPPPTMGVPKQAPVAVLVDPNSRRALSTHVLAQGPERQSNSCILPRAIVHRPKTDRLYVACLGIDAVLELDAAAADPMRAEMARFDVGRGPTGLALSEEDGVLVSAGEFDGVLSVVSLASGSVTHISLDVPVAAVDEDARVGRELFFRSSDSRISADGIACASCHPDGADDGLTWITPEGPRQTIMLAGRIEGTAPYGWTRKKGELNEYIADTSRRLGGGRLELDDVKRLAHFVEHLPAPPQATAGSDAVQIARGKAAFAEQGCEGCHISARTDGVSHDLERPSAPKPDSAFDTPSLVRVRLSAPYYHDGRYPSLEALLADRKSHMGRVGSLTPDQQRDLRVFMESL